ncbi:glutathione S-transferase N-terminal domain-containing protein [Rhizorhabdus histidinilytica]
MSAPAPDGVAAPFPPMKLHWSPSSPFVRKVLVVARELDLLDRIACERAVVGPARLNRDLMDDNPLNKIPTLVAGSRWSCSIRA